MKDHLTRRDGCDHCGLKRAILTSDPADTMTAYSIERAKQQWYKAVEYAPIDEEERLPMILDHIDLWTNVSESSGTKIPIHHGQEYLDKDNKMTMVQPIVLLPLEITTQHLIRQWNQPSNGIVHIDLWTHVNKASGTMIPDSPWPGGLRVKLQKQKQK